MVIQLKQDSYFRFRCTEYEREIIRQLKKVSEKKLGISTLSESDVVRMAIMQFADKYLSASELADMKKDFE